MNYTAKSFCMLLHHLKRVRRRISAVNDDRKVEFPRQFKLPLEPFFLYLMRFVIPIIVKSNFSNCHNLISLALFSQICKFFLIQYSYFIRMHTYCRIDKWILLCQLYHFCAGLKSGTDINNRANAIFLHRI